MGAAQGTVDARETAAGEATDIEASAGHIPRYTVVVLGSSESGHGSAVVLVCTCGAKGGDRTGSASPRVQCVWRTRHYALATMISAVSVGVVLTKGLGLAWGWNAKLGAQCCNLNLLLGYWWVR